MEPTLPPMRAVCAWCKQAIGDATAVAAASPTSHGICERCAGLLERFDQRRLGAFLDDIRHPVLCVDDDVRVLHGNRAAAAALGTDSAAMRGRLGGEVVQCAHSRQGGGCGHTASCSACVIRGSVDTTFRTGRPVLAAEAWQEVFTEDGVRRQHLRVSTERSGQFVLLHIDRDGGA